MFSFQPQEYTLKQTEETFRSVPSSKTFTNSFSAIEEAKEGQFMDSMRVQNNNNPFEESMRQANLRDKVSSEAALLEPCPPFLQQQQHSKQDSCNSVSSIDTTFSHRLRRFNSSSSVGSQQSAGTFNGLPLSPTTTSGMLKKVAKFALQPGVKLLKNEDTAKLMSSPTDSTFFIDVRPFTEFNSGHVTNSINLNIPSTLLKRPNFTLQKCLGNITFGDNVRLTNFLESHEIPHKRIVFYEQYEIINGEVPLTLYGCLNKFINDESCDAELCVVESGFQSFGSQYPEFVDNARVSTSSSQQTELKPPPHGRSLSLANIPSTLSVSPNLARFHLPKIPQTPVFKIRHNEEFYDFDNYKVLNEFKFLSLAMNHSTSDKTPKWLTNLFEHSSKLSLIEKFKSLEIEERNRINAMISSDGVGSGIELGFKNRYKDIFPYEHSRVKLASTPTHESHDYINANFVSAPNVSRMKYIATQAPLESTAKDFAKLCHDNRVELIITLTSQFENGVEKCYPYWDDINFDLLETYKSDEMVIRRLKSNPYNEDILQIQILNWSDLDVLLNSQQDDVLKLIYLKSMILERLHKTNDNVIVHCSAGCGRTGTFCTLDSIINEQFVTNESSIEGYNVFDPVFETVEAFRNQRISMVQNLRQYLFIYDCLLNYYENFNGFSNEVFHLLDNLEILVHFFQKESTTVLATKKLSISC